ncbi:MAG: hypothetical protein HRU42_15540 [Shewanella sp.]|nr:hypothetical protein [Shewanella sp.]
MMSGDIDSRVSDVMNLTSISPVPTIIPPLLPAPSKPSGYLLNISANGDTSPVVLPGAAADF